MFKSSCWYDSVDKVRRDVTTPVQAVMLLCSLLIASDSTELALKTCTPSARRDSTPCELVSATLYPVRSPQAVGGRAGGRRKPSEPLSAAESVPAVEAAGRCS